MAKYREHAQSFDVVIVKPDGEPIDGAKAELQCDGTPYIGLWVVVPAIPEMGQDAVEAFLVFEAEELRRVGDTRLVDVAAPEHPDRVERVHVGPSPNNRSMLLIDTTNRQYAPTTPALRVEIAIDDLRTFIVAATVSE
jgi:hypothetical protein